MDLLIHWYTVFGDVSAKSLNNKQLRTLILSVQDEKALYRLYYFTTCWCIGRSVSHCHSDSDILMKLISQPVCLLTAWHNGLGLSIGFLTLYFCSNPWWTAGVLQMPYLLDRTPLSNRCHMSSWVEWNRRYSQITAVNISGARAHMNEPCDSIANEQKQAKNKQRIQAQFKLHI